MNANEKIPSHIAIIMDGNGRWADVRKLPKQKGHREGLEATKRIVTRAAQIGVKYLSFYVFSTENWKRMAEEVSFLMGLIGTHLKKEYDFYKKNGARLYHIGKAEGLPKDVLKDIREVEEKTKNFNNINLALAINYGGNDEIIRALKRFVSSKILSDKISREEVFENLKNLNSNNFYEYLDSDFPPVDLLIRTSGEFRISNFLLYQISYAEFYFDDKFWPDWTGDDLEKAISEYSKRNRRFGGRG